MESPKANSTPRLAAAFKQLMRLVYLIKPYWKMLLKGMLIAPFAALLGMVTPYLTKLLIDEVYPTQDVTLMNVIVGGMLALAISISFIRALEGYYNLFYGTKIKVAARLMLFNHLQHLPVQFFNKHRVGEINSRFQDMNSALDSMNKIFQTTIGQGIYLVVVPVFLFLLQWKLALVALISIPLSVIVTTVIGRSIRKYWKKSTEAYATLNAFQIETLSHVRTMKSFALEQHNYNKASNHMDNAMQMQLRAGLMSQIAGMINGLIGGMNTALFTWLGWTFILTGQMTLGSYIAFTSYIGFLYRPLSEFVRLYSDFQRSAVNLERMFEYLDEPAEQNPALVYAPQSSINKKLRGSINLSNLSFSYSEDKPLLSNISLDFQEGKTIALVGPSGVGKSTLFQLLIRMLEPDSGYISIGGKALNQIPIAELRKQITVVWQEFSLVKGTIWDNLTMGLSSASRDVVDEIVEICRLDPLMASLPDGYNTSIAEWGVNLSGGQRQRMALARALIRDTPILMLDEVTANVDMNTEDQILNDLFSYVEEKTVIYITHRLSTAKRAEQICVLGNGTLMGFGTHQRLIEDNVYYQNMHAEWTGFDSIPDSVTTSGITIHSS